MYFVAGFGAMGWVEGDAYRAAAPDPLAPHAAGILAHMNADHAEALLLYCRAFAGVAAERGDDDRHRSPRAARARPDRRRPARVAHRLPAPGAHAGEARAVLVEMVREARARA